MDVDWGELGRLRQLKWGKCIHVIGLWGQFLLLKQMHCFKPILMYAKYQTRIETFDLSVFADEIFCHVESACIHKHHRLVEISTENRSKSLQVENRLLKIFASAIFSLVHCLMHSNSFCAPWRVYAFIFSFAHWLALVYLLLWNRRCTYLYMQMLKERANNFPYTKMKLFVFLPLHQIKQAQVFAQLKLLLMSRSFHSQKRELRCKDLWIPIYAKYDKDMSFKTNNFLSGEWKLRVIR